MKNHHDEGSAERQPSHVGTGLQLCTTLSFLLMHAKGSCNNTLLRRVVKRFFQMKCFLQGFLDGALQEFQ